MNTSTISLTRTEGTWRRVFALSPLVFNACLVFTSREFAGRYDLYLTAIVCGLAFGAVALWAAARRPDAREGYAGVLVTGCGAPAMFLTATLAASSHASRLSLIGSPDSTPVTSLLGVYFFVTLYGTWLLIHGTFGSPVTRT